MAALGGDNHDDGPTLDPGLEREGAAPGADCDGETCEQSSDGRENAAPRVEDAFAVEAAGAAMAEEEPLEGGDEEDGEGEDRYY